MDRLTINSGFGLKQYGKEAFGMIDTHNQEIREIKEKINEIVEFINKIQRAVE